MLSLNELLGTRKIFPQINRLNVVAFGDKSDACLDLCKQFDWVHQYVLDNLGVYPLIGKKNRSLITRGSQQSYGFSKL